MGNPARLSAASAASATDKKNGRWEFMLRSPPSIIWSGTARVRSKICTRSGVRLVTGSVGRERERTTRTGLQATGCLQGCAANRIGLHGVVSARITPNLSERAAGSGVADGLDVAGIIGGVVYGCTGVGDGSVLEGGYDDPSRVARAEAGGAEVEITVARATGGAEPRSLYVRETAAGVRLQCSIGEARRGQCRG